MAIPESQTRVIAWRFAADSNNSVSKPILSDSGNVSKELKLANEYDRAADFLRLEKLLIDKGRVWIESANKGKSLEILSRIRSEDKYPKTLRLWSHYFVSISNLFSGISSANDFSPDKCIMAKGTSLEHLYLAERMENLRKSGNLKGSIEIVNSLKKNLSEFKKSGSYDNSISYSVGTGFFLIGNLLRHGGQYQEASQYIDSAFDFYNPSISSHRVELHHCLYTKSVCNAMIGQATIEYPYEIVFENDYLFANALIDVIDAHAWWNTGNIVNGAKSAQDAETKFKKVGASNYAMRANSIGKLMALWGDLERQDFDTI